MKSKLFFLVTLLMVLTSPIVSAQAPSQQEEITLTTYYPAPFGDYDTLITTLLGVGTASPSPTTAVDIAPVGVATMNNDVLTAVHIRPTFNDAGFSGVQHNGLLVETGNVGIGTTTPGSTLDLNGTLSVRGLATAPAVAPTDQGRIYFDSNTDTFMVSENNGAYAPLGGGGGVGGWTDDGAVVRLTTATDNVGIGTTAPGLYKLKVDGPTHVMESLTIGNTTDFANSPSLRLATTGGEALQSNITAFYRHPSRTVIACGTTRVLSLKDNGNVGIGTMDPNPYKLYVNGTIAHKGLTDVCSKRFKKDIEYLSMTDYQAILSNIKQMNMARFRYKEADSGSRRTIGIIAEDAPEGLLSDDSMGINAITYASYSIAAIKVLQEEIEQLKAEIEILKGR